MTLGLSAEMIVVSAIEREDHDALPHNENSS